MDFSIPDTTKKVIDKIENPKDIKKVITSKKTSIEDKLLMIESEVNRILGRYKEDTLLIKTKTELVEYIDKAIENKLIAIDTETNNSLDPITCKIMGPCIYTPGLKNAYIPINHIDLQTNERLEWQLTENDIYEQFSRLGSVGNEKDIEIITHNGKFDYEVLYCTTGWKMPVTWDTMIAARLLNENERAGLKEQYRTKIDPTQEKYDIENLFAKLEYAIIPPELFALYSATDPFLTYKLYEYQKKLFEDADLNKVYKLYKEIEMPIMFISAQMELDGICFDTDYCDRLKTKYYGQLTNINADLNKELKLLAPKIATWRMTKDAQDKSLKKGWTFVKASGGPGDESYYIGPDGNQYIRPPDGKIYGKSKSEQLNDPPELTSPTQLAILLYDVLNCPVTDKKMPRGTGKEVLEALANSYPICKLILKQRELLKLIDAFLESLPKKVSPKDGRIHSHFNQLGTDTGRFSCTEPNLQQIPSHNPEIRLLFKAQTIEHTIILESNSFILPRLDELETTSGWIASKDLQIGMQFNVLDDVNNCINLHRITNITQLDSENYKIDSIIIK